MLPSFVPDRVRWALRMLKAYDSYEIIQKGGPPVYFDGDGLRVQHRIDHLNEPRFKKAFEKSVATGAFIDMDGKSHEYVVWRFYNLCWIADFAKRLDGDFIECGVYKGAGSRTVCEYIDFNSLNKDFYLLDTYQGVPLELLQPHEKQPVDYGRHGSYVEDTRRNFSSFPRVHIIEGKIPDTLSQVPSQRIAYLHIDLNSLVPELAVLDTFWHRMVPGGFIVSDDYGHGGHEPQRAAWNKWAKAKGLEVWMMPTGQGVLIKPE